MNITITKHDGNNDFHPVNEITFTVKKYQDENNFSYTPFLSVETFKSTIGTIHRCAELLDYIGLEGEEVYIAEFPSGALLLLEEAVALKKVLR